MPLVTITTKKDRHPAEYHLSDSPEQALTARLGEAIPDLIVDNCTLLNLNPKETPKDAVQVNYELFHPRAVNSVDIWIRIVFTEYAKGDSMQIAVREALKKLLLGWFESLPVSQTDAKPKSLALDVFWGPGRGFLMNGTSLIEW